MTNTNAGDLDLSTSKRPCRCGVATLNRDSKTITKWDPCYKIKPKVLKLHHFTGWLLTRDLD